MNEMYSIIYINNSLKIIELIKLKQENNEKRGKKQRNCCTDLRTLLV
jgi:hypothetical protein